MIRRILVVCTGNVCRSPMAQGLLQQMLPDRSVTSAGLAALAGYPADAGAITVSAAAGIDISAHRARSLTAAQLGAADLVLVMTSPQKRDIQCRYPQHSGKVFRIGGFTGDNVPDPHGGRLKDYEQSFGLIRKAAVTWASRIAVFA